MSVKKKLAAVAVSGVLALGGAAGAAAFLGGGTAHANNSPLLCSQQLARDSLLALNAFRSRQITSTQLAAHLQLFEVAYLACIG